MPRIRSIHPGFFDDDSVLCVPFPARLLLIGIWTQCDDRGVFAWKPAVLQHRILGGMAADIAPLLTMLREQDLIRRFEADGREWGAVRNFCYWQRPKAPQYVHPCPPEIATYVGFETPKGAPERGTALARLLHDRQSSCCAYCDQPITFYRKRANSLEIDHRTPISRGGADQIDNLAGACRPCNQLKGGMTAEEFAAAYPKSQLIENHRKALIRANATGDSQSAKDLFGGSASEIPSQRKEEGRKVS